MQPLCEGNTFLSISNQLPLLCPHYYLPLFHPTLTESDLDVVQHITAHNNVCFYL
jgi:hypothetical protein